MDRKIKVWIILLIVLLFAAIAGVLVINNSLSNSQKALEAVNIQLADETAKLQTLTADYDAINVQLSDSQAAVASLETELGDAQAAVASLETELGDAQAAVASLETELGDAQAQVSSLETQLAEAQPAEEQAAEAEAQPAAAEAQPAEEQAAEAEVQPAAAEAQPVVADATIEATIAALEGAALDYEQRIISLEAAASEAEKQIDQLTKENEAAVAEVNAIEAEIVEISEEFDVSVEEITQESIDELYAEIEAIVNSQDASMTDEEKVAALAQLRARISLYTDKLRVALDDVSEKEKALAASTVSIETLEAELVSAQGKVDELNAVIGESEATIAGLEKQIADLTTANADNSVEAQAKIDGLNAQIATEQGKVDLLSTELEQAQLKLDNCLAEMEVYKLSRELASGEAYTASTLENALVVAADGVSVQWTYTNDTISGNYVVLSLLLDNEEIYRSAALQPGESLTDIKLSRALEAGEYDAVSVTGVFSAEGERVSATRVPVRIVVG